MTVFRFRAPGQELDLEALLARLSPAASAAQSSVWRSAVARARVAATGWSRGPVFGRRRVAPGTALWLETDEDLPDAGEAAAPGSPWIALVPALAWLRGALDTPVGRIDFAVCGEQGGVQAIRLAGAKADAFAIRAALAQAGSPVLGDVRHEGILVAGGLRLRPGSEAGADDWPDEPVFPPDASGPGDGAVLSVSAASLRAVRAGHPWILADPETGDAGRFRRGDRVWIEAPGKRRPRESRTLVRVEGTGPLVARVWAQNVARPRDAASVEARVAAAVKRREKLIASCHEESGCDAFRLIHGEADGLPGLAVDRLGPVLRVLVESPAALAFHDRVIDALGRMLGEDLPVVEVRHLRGSPPGALERVRVARGEWDAAPFEVAEAGLRFRVDAGLGEPDRSRPGVGLFLDQRVSRARARRSASGGGRFANLFAHTGSFSVALLAGGAEHVVSVDLSAAYLSWLEDNLARNELASSRRDRRPAGGASGRHESVRGDARHFIETRPPDERFDGIVLDPPTAAAAGRNFWSTRQDLLPLVRACLARLAPGGWLLVSHNRRARRGRLAGQLQRAAEGAGVRLAALEPARPGADFPSLAGFPEGDPFEGVWALRA